MRAAALRMLALVLLLPVAHGQKGTTLELHKAAASNNVDKLRELLAAGASVETEGAYKGTLLHSAAENATWRPSRRSWRRARPSTR